VVVADDHPVVRDGLSVLLGLQPDVVIVGQAADGEEAVSVVLEARPDVVLIDLRMPLLSGVGAIRRIRAVDPNIRFVVLTTYADDAEVAEAFRAGALGFLTKDAGRQEIYEALLAAAAGQGLVSQGAQRSLAAAEKAPAPRAGQEREVPDGLTPRECDVLRLIAAGRSNREMMQLLQVSEATVKTHINRIFAKTQVRDRAQAVRYAYRNGLASLSDS
jgi:DNA-binding NarL/FixJ family response regulator